MLWHVTVAARPSAPQHKMTLFVAVYNGYTACPWSLPAHGSLPSSLPPSSCYILVYCTSFLLPKFLTGGKAEVIRAHFSFSYTRPHTRLFFPRVPCLVEPSKNRFCGCSTAGLGGLRCLWFCPYWRGSARGASSPLLSTWTTTSSWCVRSDRGK